MAQPHEREYILGTHDEEARRLGLQHRLWSDAAHEDWKRAGLRPGMRVLDVGCGPGFAALDMVQVVTGDPVHHPGGLVVGVDESARYVESLRSNAAARGFGREVVGIVGDVMDLAGAIASDGAAGGRGVDGAGSFDLAYARWVLCFVPRPMDVVRGVAGLLKAGGRWVVHDYFNYESMALAPRCASFERVVKAVGASWRSRGGDPDVMARVPGMCVEAGLTVEHLSCDERVARPGDAMWTWPDTFFRIFVPTLVQHGFLSQPHADEFTDDWRKWSKMPGAFGHLPPVYRMVARKA